MIGECVKTVVLVFSEYVLAKLNASGASALERDIVLQRFYLRESEWVNPKIRKVIEKADATKQIAWNLDGSGNGVSTLIEQQRAFALKAQQSPVSTQQWPTMKGRTYEQVRVGNKPMVGGKSVAGTLLVPVTQDVDMMAILTASGEIVSAELRAKYYEFLSNLIGTRRDAVVGLERGAHLPGQGEDPRRRDPRGRSSGGFRADQNSQRRVL